VKISAQARLRCSVHAPISGRTERFSPERLAGLNISWQTRAASPCPRLISVSVSGRARRRFPTAPGGSTLALASFWRGARHRGVMCARAGHREVDAVRALTRYPAHRRDRGDRLTGTRLNRTRSHRTARSVRGRPWKPGLRLVELPVGATKIGVEFVDLPHRRERGRRALERSAGRKAHRGYCTSAEVTSCTTPVRPCRQRPPWGLHRGGDGIIRPPSDEVRDRRGR